jgi:hypothetical protein
MFLRRTRQQMNVTGDVAEKMWEPALAALKEKHIQWIDEDLEELETLILKTGVWWAAPPDESGVLPPGSRNPDDDEPEGGFAGGGHGSTLVAVGLAVASVVRARQR